MNSIKRALIALLLALPLAAHAGESENKDLTILRLQKIIAEQSMAELLRDEKVKDYARIKANYDKLLAEMAAKEKKDKDGKP